MTNTWGNLEAKDKQAIQSNTRKLTETEIKERYAKKDSKTVFKIIRKTDRALAGVLDIDREEEELKLEEPSVEITFGIKEFTPAKETLKEKIKRYEIAEITLISPEDFDYEPKITKADKKAAEPIDKLMSKFEGYFVQDTAMMMGECATAGPEAKEFELPPLVDHRARQSPVKDQGTRGTCVSHAVMGLIEAFGHIPDDLSEQYTHYKFNELTNRPQNIDAGLKTTDAAPLLSRNDGRTCLESEWPYIPDQSTINSMIDAGTYKPPQAALDHQKFGIGAYKIITDQGLTGESIKNTRYLESLLYKGYDIVIGTWVSWDDKDNNGILDPVLDPSGNPVGAGGHAMLVVGYNRDEQYFIVKNSWNKGWGHDGYAYFHYSLIRSCFKYGFVVDKVIPESDTELPQKLAKAPFNKEKISRSQLNSAVLFIKTSSERYAVCEAYAGDNLLLRNLRVYNADGSLHLEKESLVIRGTYLCDVDSGQETDLDADFWWEAVSPGVNNLVPRNNAAVYVAFDLAKLDAEQISKINFSSAPIAFNELNYAIVVGSTTSNRRFKMLVHARPDNRLNISYLELYNANGSRFRNEINLYVPSSWTYNLDTLQIGEGQFSDIWWHVISDGVGFLERYSRARTQLIWNL